MRRRQAGLGHLRRRHRHACRPDRGGAQWPFRRAGLCCGPAAVRAFPDRQFAPDRLRESNIWTRSKGFGNSFNTMDDAVSHFGLIDSFENRYAQLDGGWNQDLIQPQSFALQTRPEFLLSGRRELFGGLAYADYDVLGGRRRRGQVDQPQRDRRAVHGDAGRNRLHRPEPLRPQPLPARHQRAPRLLALRLPRDRSSSRAAHQHALAAASPRTLWASKRPAVWGKKIGLKGRCQLLN